MQIGGGGIQNLLVNMTLKTKLKKNENSKIHSSMFLQLIIGLTNSNDLWDVELSYLNKFQDESLSLELLNTFNEIQIQLDLYSSESNSSSIEKN
jgi:hypothetical protein